MKNANVWIICAGLAASMILGLAAPLDESRERAETRRASRANDSDFAAIGACPPFVAGDVRYAEVELRLDSLSRPASLGF